MDNGAQRTRADPPGGERRCSSKYEHTEASPGRQQRALSPSRVGDRSAVPDRSTPLAVRWPGGNYVRSPSAVRSPHRYPSGDALPASRQGVTHWSTRLLTRSWDVGRDTEREYRPRPWGGAVQHLHRPEWVVGPATWLAVRSPDSAGDAPAAVEHIT
jgi:hypothetical protein